MNVPETLAGPEWAHGCENCEYGLIVAPELRRELPLNVSEQRSAQAAEGMLIFCECKAGQMYRQYLSGVYVAQNNSSRQSMRERVAATFVPTIHAA